MTVMPWPSVQVSGTTNSCWPAANVYSLAGD